ncbi:MAG: site-specific integrase [Rhizobium sp.]|nr:site-specific integrase [Rhizobium sp.]
MKRDFPKATAVSTAIPKLPSSARTRGGVTFDPTADNWVFRDGVRDVSLYFTFAPSLSDELRHSFKAVLLWYSENASASHLQNMHSHFVRFASFLASTSSEQIDSVTSIHILNYKASLTKDKASYLGALSGFIKKWHGLGYPGVTDDAVSVLKELRINGNAKGVAVLTMDPLSGPFTQVEVEALRTSLDSAYADGAIDEDLYFLARLFMALGQRPSQYAALKVCDISVAKNDKEELDYTLQMPRAKQRNQHLRLEFTPRQLKPWLGSPLLEYCERVRANFKVLLGDPGQAPMFPYMSSEKFPFGYEYHHTGRSLSRALTEMLNKLKVFSERTGNLLHIMPVRFRRTVGTRAAQEGHGELVIAKMLDHSDTQNVGVYVASVPEIAARIDKAVAMKLAPLAQAFIGRLIQDESEATRHDDPSSRIIDLRIDRSAQPMGSCGQYSFCGFSAPVACYICRHFEPWLDGPHEAVLAHLLSKRDQLLKTTDERMASINDRTILAVAQVIQLCQASLAKEDSSNG